MESSREELWRGLDRDRRGQEQEEGQGQRGGRATLPACPRLERADSAERGGGGGE